ncbi:MULTISPECIES: ABC transporter ATP-binding protein [Pseudonocardia]|jgi:ABC-2 type transport system ATP-binding protein|uniref:ABC transporter ATP-binding protein n=1 Tax=Pseudonocardia TaxID=1847 RepID=UPI000CD0A36D|nr:ATP-binding cassette domain-containing protein [Pseudonocardia dioxanivorans]GJF04535.1 ABC transporter ATP-binding protein [Pseudonocardia sp. D17]
MIEVRGLTKRYRATVAVDDLSFDVRPGVVTGFLGPNGAGKSTTMRMVLDLDRPDAGEVRIDGRRYRELSRPMRTVGALLDAKWVHPNRSARQHLRWMAAASGIPASRADEVLETVGLTSVAGKRAGTFSLGMAQRLGIAGALLGDPPVLMFDEPVNGLDPEGIRWIRTLMQRLAAEGRTVFVSSHLLSEMALTAQELVVIGRGRLISQGPTTAFVDGAAGSAVLVRSPAIAQLVPIVQAAGFAVVPDPSGGARVSGATTEQVGDLAAAHGLALHELTLLRGSLEEAFMQITGRDVEFTAGGPTSRSAVPAVGQAGGPPPAVPDGLAARDRRTEVQS